MTTLGYASPDPNGSTLLGHSVRELLQGWYFLSKI